MYSNKILCNTSEITIQYGLRVRFEHISGHTINDKWRIGVFPQQPQATFSVAPKVFNGVVLTPNYTQSNPIWYDYTYNSQSNNAGDFNFLLTGNTSAL